MLRLKPLLRNLTIIKKNLEVGKFDLDQGEFGWAQSLFCDEIERQYNAGKAVRIIVLKARQLGISTATEGVLFNWAFLHPGSNGLVIAHENDSSSSLFQKTKLYWDTWPWRANFSLKYSTKREMHWLETNSTLRVATAKNLGAGRGSTLHAVHASECAYYLDAQSLMIGLRQTIPSTHGTIIVLESTANGVGDWFHEQWEAAWNGESEYSPLFFPWYHHYEYSVPTTLSTKLELTPYERNLLRQGCTYENIAWRRWAVPNLAAGDDKLFMQEYPATPDEAFISTGTPIFPHLRLQACYQEEQGVRGMLIENSVGGMNFVQDPTGPLTIFRRPKPRDNRQDRYFVSGDPSMTIEGDPACIQVINRQTFEQVAVWHGRIDPITFADELIKVGVYYNSAMICPEVEGGGQSTIATLLARNYPSLWQHRWADKAPGKVSISFGWSTNFQRKAWCIGQLKKLIADTSIIIHDRLTYGQLRQYVVRNNGEWGNADSNTNDDSVMALAIGVTASMTEGPFQAEASSSGNVIVDIFNQELDREDGDDTAFG